jgi:hypothetical protein
VSNATKRRRISDKKSSGAREKGATFAQTLLEAAENALAQRLA